MYKLGPEAAMGGYLFVNAQILDKLPDEPYVKALFVAASSLIVAVPLVVAHKNEINEAGNKFLNKSYEVLKNLF